MMAIVTFRRYKFDSRTVKMIKWAEKEARMEAFKITQGSYSKGVAASAGTHDGGGVVDFSCRGMSTPQLAVMLRALKDAGFAVWHRPARDGVWSEHVHAVAIGCPDLAPIAKRQVTSFDARRDGLASNKHDDTYRPNPPVRFDEKLNKPVSRRKPALAGVKNAVNRKKVK